MGIRFLEIAQIEIDEAIEYYNSESSGLGDLFLLEALNTIERIRHFPNAWPVSSTEIGGYFGNITCSAVTKIGTRLKDRMATDEILRDEMKKIEERLSRVNG